VFLNEARQHLEALEREVAAVAAGGSVQEEFVRVAHTLAGICGTTQMRAMHTLGQSLEGALLRLRSAEQAPDPAAQAAMAQAFNALRQMYVDVLERRAPAPRPDLEAALSAVPASIEAAGSAEASEPVAAPESAHAVEPPPQAGTEVLQVPAQPVPLPEEPRVVSGDELAMDRRLRRIEDDVDPQLLPIFLEEAQDLTPRAGELLRTWRREPANLDHAKALQRVLHTFKGSARMAGAMGLGELTHHMEARVETALSLNLAPTSMFDDLENSYDRMGHLLERLQKPLDTAPVEKPAEEAASAQARPEIVAEGAASSRAVMRVRAEVLEKLVNQAGEISISRSRIETEVRALKGALTELVENVGRLRGQLREIEIQAESQMLARSREAEAKHESFDPLEFDRFSRFQELARMMAESVSDVGTVQQTISKVIDEADETLAAQARMNRELQQDLMRVRMVPVGSAADRLHRVVRQTAKELGRRANLDLRGEGVEVDRSVLERMLGPLEHLLRNSIAHGIEPPASRAAAGKAETGEIRLDVRQEGQEVTLTLSDDGAGLNLERIRERGIERGLIKPGESPGERALADLIFLPGFSTAETLTELAGRGVGMDVVKNEVGSLGGRIELTTTPGQGTKFLVRLPLTTAVTQAVLVKSGTRSCALPSVMVEQVQQLRPEQLAKVRASGGVDWAGRRYPFCYLPELLAEPGAPEVPRKYHPVLLLRAGAESVALLVDEMIGNQEVVVKNIGPQLARVPGVTGATVLGTGEIVLILNPVQLAQAPRPQMRSAAQSPAKAEAVRPRVMVVDDSLTVRKITGRLLAREGYEVLVAKDGVEALEQLSGALPDVMLVDVEMPRMDGFDLTRNVRGDERLKAVPIIMITSRTADKHRSYAAEIGVNVFLGKPYQEDELLGHIAGFVGR
jgi:chemosensory pili system protein ChpA (sensor histidine kinase/response regulator)